MGLPGPVFTATVTVGCSLVGPMLENTNPLKSENSLTNINIIVHNSFVWALGVTECEG